MVFQYYSLYKNMTVYDNLSFGMKLKKCSTEQIEAAVKEAADMLGLEELLNRRLKILSEGQKKRVFTSSRAMPSRRSSSVKK